MAFSRTSHSSEMFLLNAMALLGVKMELGETGEGRGAVPAYLPQ